jgi:hypothetical protein
MHLFPIETTIINASKGGKPDRKPYHPMVSYIHTKPKPYHLWFQISTKKLINEKTQVCS